MINIASIHEGCKELNAALAEKAPPNYLSYVKVVVEIDQYEVSFRAMSALWQTGSDSIFSHYARYDSSEAALDGLAKAIRGFELWTPAAIAATLGLESI